MRTRWPVGGALALGALACGALLVFTKAEEPRRPMQPHAGSAPTEGPDPFFPPVPAFEKGSGPFSAAEKGPDPFSVDLEVVAEPGDPLAAALVVAFRDEEVVEEALTDGRGRLRLGSRARAAEAVIVPLGWGAYRTTLPDRAGPGRLVLPNEGVVAGQVLIEGRPPESPITLRLEARERQPALCALPPAVLLAIDRRGRLPRDRTVPILERHTGAEGRFLLGGLPRDRSVILTVPEEFELEGEARANQSLFLEQPEGSLVVRLRRTPTLTGRVIARGGGPPVPGARVRDGPMGREIHADGSGRFRLLVGTGTTWLQVIVADAEDRNQRIVPIEERFFGGGDLGDVELGPVRSLSLVVRDRAGAPVQGAVAVAATGRTRRPTDAEGRGSLELAGPEDSIEVGALGYGVVDVPIPPGVPEPVVVTLAPQALLVVHVLGPTGEAPRGLWVEVAGNEGDCTEPDLRGAHRACGGLPAAILECEAMFTTTASHPVGEAGMLRFPDLHADRPLTVFLRDASGLSLDSRPVTLAPEETRHVTLRCDRTPRDFHGIVTDPRGRPVEEADVLLRRDSSGAGFLHRTGPDGSFRIEALYAETVGLEVSKDGFAVLVAPGRRIAPAGAPEVFRLEQGHPVLLTVLDAAGRRFAEADSIDALVPSASEGTTRVGGIESLEPGVFRVTSLPTGTVRLRLGIAGRSYEIAHEASTPEARLIVPCHGSLVARWSLAGGPAPRSVRLVPEAEEGGQYFHLPNDGPLVGEHRVAAVHPGVYRVRLALPVPDTYDTVELEERVTVLPDATVEVTFRR